MKKVVIKFYNYQIEKFAQISIEKYGILKISRVMSDFLNKNKDAIILKKEELENLFKRVNTSFLVSKSNIEKLKKIKEELKKSNINITTGRLIEYIVNKFKKEPLNEDMKDFFVKNNNKGEDKKVRMLNINQKTLDKLLSLEKEIFGEIKNKRSALLNYLISTFILTKEDINNLKPILATSVIDDKLFKEIKVISRKTKAQINDIIFELL